MMIAKDFVDDTWITRESEDTEVFDEKDMTILDRTCITISRDASIEVEALGSKLFRKKILMKNLCLEVDEVEIDEVEIDRVEDISRRLDR